jgi:hypothetical protein
MEQWVARDAAEALSEFYDYNRDEIRAARDRNMKVELVTFEEYTKHFYDQMHHPCPH